MMEPNTKRTKSVRNRIVIFALTAILMFASTYAWFIGMRTVNVSSFDVEIASTDSLLLSLDGQKWSTTVNISKDTLDKVSYTGNTNSWGGNGLVPMSSVGDIDTGVSRLKLFEKASLTATPGGYRLLASRVNNFENNDPEQEGYVAFDLFIHNFSGHQYIEELNPADEEAIYLTTDSSVTIPIDNGGVANTGIENSVRVAFAQIGRVVGTTTAQGTITGITCDPNTEGKPSIKDGVTGICRTAQIWEPNDTRHVDAAISWYDTSCLKRKIDGTDVTLKASYSVDPVVRCSAASPVVDLTANPTYAVAGPIASNDNVDVYDGFNSYTDTIDSTEKPLLKRFDYFTDSMKSEIGMARPQFITLAPNSITKVRVYIYIEGQDIDNYDFAQIGKKIAVKFGFTKERYNGTEPGIDYQGPDTTIPVITLKGASIIQINAGEEFNDPGYEDVMDVDLTGTPQDITNKVITDASEIPSPTVAGTYYVHYSVTDATGNVGKATRTVIVK